MLKFKGFIYLSTAGLLCLTIPPATAQPLSEVATTQIPRVKDLPRQATNVKEWLTQATPAVSVVRITAVRLNQTQSGLNVVLETAGGEVLQGTTSTQGNRLTVEIPNAQLQLAEGQSFRREKPIPGIIAVELSQSTATTVRVTVTGVNSLPEGTVVQSQSGLMLSLLLPETEEELVVTAQNVTVQKRPEKPQNIPISLTILNRQEIEDAQVNSIRSVAVNTPNVYATTNDRLFNFYSVRGLGNSNFFVRDSTAFYIDDVPYEYAHQFFSGVLFDLERVEVLRGPQNTLYGRNSQAGVVNIISRPPANRPEYGLNFGYGNFNQREVGVSLSDAIIPDRLAFRLAGTYLARDAFTENTLLNRGANPQSSLAGRANLLWTPSKEWSVSFNATGTGTNDGDTVYVPSTQRDRYTTQLNFPGGSQLSVNTQALKVAYDGPALSFTSVTARNGTNLNYNYDGDYTADDLIRSTLTLNSTIWSQEFRLQSPKTADRFQWILGGFFQSRSFDLDPLSNTSTPLAELTFGSPAGKNSLIAKFDQKTYAVFGQIDFKPVKPLTLTAGLRYESSKESLNRDNEFQSPTGEIIPDPATRLRNTEANDDVVLPRLAIAYRFTPNVSVYGSASRGYKPPTQNYTATSDRLLSVNAEKSWNYEVGLKSTWFDNRLTANFTAFQNNVDDYQVVLTGASGFFQDIANAKVSVRGVEFELNAKPIKGVEIIAGVGTANAKYDSYINPFTGDNFNGKRPIFSPDYTFNLALQYRSPGGFFSRLEAQGFGTVFFNDANTVKQAPVTLVNARVGYEWKNYGLYFYVNNVLDKEYVNQAFGDPVLVAYGDRRLFGFQMRAKF